MLVFKNSKHLSKSGFTHYILPLFVVAIIASIGGYIYLNGSSAATISNVVYFESSVSDKCLDDRYDSQANGTRDDSYTCNKTEAQEWILNNNGTIENPNGKCIDSEYGKNANNNPITVYTCSGSNAAEQWEYSGTVLKNPATNKCIDIPYANTKNGTELVLYTCNGTEQQSWTAVNANSSNTASGAPTPSSANAYYVNCTAGNDANSGKSSAAAWKSLPRVTDTTFAAGATIFLDRGCAWDGGVSINGNGTATKPITVASYGSGAAPIVMNSKGTQFTSAINLNGQYQTVENLLIENASESGININQSHNTVEYNEITNTGTGVASAPTGTYAFITHNTVHDLKEVVNKPNDTGDYGAVGFDLGSGNDEVSYNSCVHCEAQSDEYGEDGGFVEVYNNGDNLYVHNNWAQDDNGFIEIGGASGSSSETHAYDIRIDTNVLLNDGDAVNIHSTGMFAIPATVSFDNNTFYNSIPLSDTAVFYAPSSELIAQNNIFYSNMSMHSTPGTHSGNLYDMIDGATIGYTLSSSEKTGNPLFVDAAKNNFHLQVSSPARSMGTGGLGYTSDYDGVTLPANKVDAGAFQYVR